MDGISHIPTAFIKVERCEEPPDVDFSNQHAECSVPQVSGSRIADEKHLPECGMDRSADLPIHPVKVEMIFEETQDIDSCHEFEEYSEHEFSGVSETTLSAESSNETFAGEESQSLEGMPSDLPIYSIKAELGLYEDPNDVDSSHRIKNSTVSEKSPPRTQGFSDEEEGYKEKEDITETPFITVRQGLATPLLSRSHSESESALKASILKMVHEAEKHRCETAKLQAELLELEMETERIKQKKGEILMKISERKRDIHKSNKHK